MGGKVPQGVDVGPDPAQVESLAVDIPDVAQLARVDQFLHVPDGRIVEEGVADHRDELLFTGEVADLVDLGDGCGDRLFDQDVLSRLQGLSWPFRNAILTGVAMTTAWISGSYKRLANIGRDMDGRIKAADVFLPLAGQVDNRLHTASLARDHVPNRFGPQ